MTRRRVLYMAHPVGQGADIEPNLERAKRWLRWFYRAAPSVVVIAPWLLDAEALYLVADTVPERSVILGRCEAAAAISDGVALVGGRISSGMLAEARAGRMSYDLTSFGEEPPVDARVHFADSGDVIYFVGENREARIIAARRP